LKNINLKGNRINSLSADELSFSKSDWSSVENIKKEYSDKLKALRAQEESETRSLKEKYSKMLNDMEAKNKNNLESIKEYKEKLHKLSEEKDSEKENLKKTYQEKIDELKSKNKLTLEELQKNEMELMKLKKQNENEYLLLKNKELQIKELKELIIKNKKKREALEENNKLLLEQKNIKAYDEKEVNNHNNNNVHEEKENTQIKKNREIIYRGKEERFVNNNLEVINSEIKNVRTLKLPQDNNFTLISNSTEIKNNNVKENNKNAMSTSTEKNDLQIKPSNKTNPMAIVKNATTDIKKDLNQNLNEPVDKPTIDIPIHAISLKPVINNKIDNHRGNKTIKKIIKTEKVEMKPIEERENANAQSDIRIKIYKEKESTKTYSENENSNIEKNESKSNKSKEVLSDKAKKKEESALDDETNSVNAQKGLETKFELAKDVLESKDQVVIIKASAATDNSDTQSSSKLQKRKEFNEEANLIKKEIHVKESKVESEPESIKNLAASGKISLAYNDDLLYKKLNCMDRTHLDSKHFLLSIPKCRQLSYLFSILRSGFHILEQKVFLTPKAYLFFYLN